MNWGDRHVLLVDEPFGHLVIITGVLRHKFQNGVIANTCPQYLTHFTLLQTIFRKLLLAHDTQFPFNFQSNTTSHQRRSLLTVTRSFSDVFGVQFANERLEHGHPNKILFIVHGPAEPGFLFFSFFFLKYKNKKKKKKLNPIKMFNSIGRSLFWRERFFFNEFAELL